MNAIETRINEMKVKAEVLEFIKSRMDSHAETALTYQQRANNEEEDSANWYCERSAEETAMAEAYIEIAKLIK